MLWSAIDRSNIYGRFIVDILDTMFPISNMNNKEAAEINVMNEPKITDDWYRG